MKCQAIWFDLFIDFARPCGQFTVLQRITLVQTLKGGGHIPHKLGVKLERLKNGQNALISVPEVKQQVATKTLACMRVKSHQVEFYFK